MQWHCNYSTARQGMARLPHLGILACPLISAKVLCSSSSLLHVGLDLAHWNSHHTSQVCSTAPPLPHRASASVLGSAGRNTWAPRIAHGVPSLITLQEIPGSTSLHDFRWEALPAVRSAAVPLRQGSEMVKRSALHRRIRSCPGSNKPNISWHSSSCGSLAANGSVCLGAQGCPFQRTMFLRPNMKH